MSKLKDSYLTFIVKLTYHESDKQCLMIFRHLNKTISIIDITTRQPIYSQNQVSLNNKNLIVEELIIGKNLQIIVNQNTEQELTIIGYADQYTKNIFQPKTQHFQNILFFIKPGFMQNKKLGEIFSVIQTEFWIQRFKMFHLSQENVQKYIVNQKMLNTQNNSKNLAYLTSGPCFGFCISGDNHLLIKLKKIVGSQNPIQAKKMQPHSLRAKFGKSIIQNCCHYSINPKSAIQEIDFIFSNQVKEVLPKMQKNCLLLIKPHIIIEKKVGQIITFLLEKGVQFQALRFQKIKYELLKKYMDFYKFLPQYQQNIQHFQDEKSVFMAVKLKPQSQQNPFEEFKKICGPYDPQHAKKINPQSLRATFGINRVKNAIHSTQLLEDTESEIRLLFQL